MAYNVLLRLREDLGRLGKRFWIPVKMNENQTWQTNTDRQSSLVPSIQRWLERWRRETVELKKWKRSAAICFSLKSAEDTTEHFASEAWRHEGEAWSKKINKALSTADHHKRFRFKLHFSIFTWSANELKRVMFLTKNVQFKRKRWNCLPLTWLEKSKRNFLVATRKKVLLWFYGAASYYGVSDLVKASNSVDSQMYCLVL